MSPTGKPLPPQTAREPAALGPEDSVRAEKLCTYSTGRTPALNPLEGEEGNVLRWHGLWTGVYVCWSKRDVSNAASASLSSIVALPDRRGTETEDRELPWSSHMSRRSLRYSPHIPHGSNWAGPRSSDPQRSALSCNGRSGRLRGPSCRPGQRRFRPRRASSLYGMHL